MIRNLLVIILCVSFCKAQAQKPIALHPDNPHYFIYKNKPVILIGSGEHYGAVMNSEFNYSAYIDEVASKKLNLTRTFSGEYVETSSAFNISNNTMAPAAAKLICPWKRSNEPGYANGGNKFDLTKFDDAYFVRLKDFISKARSKDVIVEFTLFCPFYEDTLWAISPMNGRNNVNHIEKMASTDVYTLDKSGSLLAYQEAMVRRIVEELKSFDNVMYEICNEPYFGGVTLEWQHHIADVIIESEKNFPSKHLITQNISNGFQKIENPHAGVSVFNFHYAWPPYSVAMNYQLNKVIGDNETGFRGNSDSTYRREAWRFLIAGGGLFNHLDYSFAVHHEKGDNTYPSTVPGGGSDSLRKQFSFLIDFMNGFNFIKMHPDTTLLNMNDWTNAEARILAEPGKQYALYFYGAPPKSFSIAMPSGRYNASWLDTESGKYVKTENIESKNGSVELSFPQGDHEFAVKITSR